MIPAAATYVHNRYDGRLTWAAIERNSCRAMMETAAVISATSQFGPHQIAATTTGIRIAAVNTRTPVPELTGDLRLLRVFRNLRAGMSRASNAYDPLGQNAAARFRQAAVAPFALLKIEQGFVELGAVEIRPQGFGHINFRVGNLPQQKIADAHLPARANQQVGVGQPGGVQES